MDAGADHATPFLENEPAMSKLSIDTGLIEKLADILQRTDLTEIEVEEGEARVRVARQPAPVHAQLMPQAAVAQAPSDMVTMPLPTGDAPPAIDPADPGVVTSPMVGTAYLAPEPGAAPFISLGQSVQEGQTLLIIEAMKVMNAIRAPMSGTIKDVLVTNAAPVEFGEVLLVIE